VRRRRRRRLNALDLVVVQIHHLDLMAELIEIAPVMYNAISQ
jgi:hypothetical protein